MELGLLQVSRCSTENERRLMPLLSGIVDTHSHMGLDSAPGLKGSSDTNSHRGNTQPWLRSFDGFNTHDLAFNLSISGGITTMLVLPGSAGKFLHLHLLDYSADVMLNQGLSVDKRQPSSHGGLMRTPPKACKLSHPS